MKRSILIVALALAAASIAPAQAENCGQPVSTGTLPVASDALYILRSAVGAQPCRLEHCDVNSDCRVTSSDSLTTLFAAVGRGDGLDCSSSCPTTIPCEEAGAPVCNGTCPADYACVAIDDGGDDTDSDSDGKRVTVCHHNSGNGNGAITLVVSSAAVPAHLRHGDELGPCGDLTAAHKSGNGSDDDDSDGDSDGSVPPAPDCICEPISVTTTTMGSTTTTSMEPVTTTTLGPTTTTTLPGTTTTTLAPPTTTTLAPTTTTTLAPTTTTTLPPTTTTTVPQGPDPAAGMALYDARCQFCHKAGAHDTTGFAPDLARKGNKLRNDLGTISNQMNGLTLTNQEIADLAAWLNSL